jgi:hypothetical protein
MRADVHSFTKGCDEPGRLPCAGWDQHHATGSGHLQPREALPGLGQIHAGALDEVISKLRFLKVQNQEMCFLVHPLFNDNFKNLSLSLLRAFSPNTEAMHQTLLKSKRLAPKEYVHNYCRLTFAVSK